MHPRPWLLLVGAAVLLLPTAPADTLVLKPVADACLFSANPGNNLGGADTLAIGGTAHLQPARGLVRFDLTGALPSGALVTGARLELTMMKGPAGGVASTVRAHRLLRPWGEGEGTGNLGAPAKAGDSTWTHRVHPTEAWAAPGAGAGVDYVATASGSMPMDTLGRFSVVGDGMAADVQLWLAQPAANAGWILVDDQEQVGATARRIGTRENPGNEPKLVLEYVVSSPPVLTRWGRVGDRFELEFRAEAGNIYAVQSRDPAGADGAWSVVTNFVVKLISTNLVVSEPLSAAPARLYRVADVGDVD